MKTPLERCNSWTPFIDGLRSSMERRDFRPSKIVSLFRFIDPQFDSEKRGWRNHVRYLLFWNTTSKGRVARYLIPIHAFMDRKRKVFQNSPQEVILLFNQFLVAMLGKQDAMPFLLPEAWARVKRTKIERLLEQGKQAESLFYSITQDLKSGLPHKDERESTLSFPSISHEEEPFPQEENVFIEELPPLDPAYAQFQDLISTPDRLEERKRILEELLFRKRTLLYQLNEMKGEANGFNSAKMKEQVEAVSLEGPFFEKGVSPEEADQRIQTIRALFQSIEKTLQERWNSLSKKAVQTCEYVGESCLNISFQLWTFIAHDLVWRDLEERVTSSRNVLLPVVHSLLEAESLALRENLFYQILELDDVKALSGELFYRSTREKDCIESSLEFLHEAFYVLILCQAIQEPHSWLLELIERVEMLILSCLTPTHSFPDVATREEVAGIFRSSWEALEAERAEFRMRVESLLSSVSEERKKEYVRHTLLFLSDVERSGFLPSDVFYSAFEHESTPSVKDLIEWQRQKLNQKLRSGVLLSLLPQGERRERLRFLSEWRRREERIESFAHACLQAVHDDAPFVQTLLWNMRVLVDQFLYRMIFHKEPWERMTTLFDQLEHSLKLWWRTSPSLIKETDGLKIHEVESHALWKEGEKGSSMRGVCLSLLRSGKPTQKGNVFELFLLLYDLLDEFKKVSSSSEQVMRLSSFLQAMSREMIANSFSLSSTLLEILGDILRDIPSTSHTLQEIGVVYKNLASSANEGHSFPLIGDADFLCTQVTH